MQHSGSLEAACELFSCGLLDLVPQAGIKPRPWIGSVEAATGPSGKSPFLFQTEWFSFVLLYHILCIRSSVSWHLGCFYFLSIVNNAAINISIQISIQVPAFSSFGNIQEVDLLGHTVMLFLFIFWGIAKVFSTMAGPFYIPASSVGGLQFLHILTNTSFFKKQQPSLWMWSSYLIVILIFIF